MLLTFADTSMLGGSDRSDSDPVESSGEHDDETIYMHSFITSLLPDNSRIERYRYSTSYSRGASEPI